MRAALDFDQLDQLHTSRRSRVARARGADGVAVIVKQLNQEFPSFQENARFRREFDIARRCAHPCVVAPLSLSDAGGCLTITFADIGGVALDQVLRQRVLAPGEFFSIALQLCDAVAAVHAQGVVHKDINPSNLVWNAATGQLQLIDFGIASELPQEAQALVHPLALEGTLAYMAPEQTGRMHRLLDYRADLYAIGATLFALLAGRPPFTAADAMELIHCHIARMPDFELPALQDLPAGLAAILQRLLQKDAERRYQSVAGLRADLAACRDARAPQPARLADRAARFVMPQTLVGRENEVAALMAAFERVALGGTELLLVGGFSGIGKSALVHEVHRPILARRGIFLAGKFDQFRRDVPYASLLEALRALVRQLLSEPEAQLAAHRQALHAALDAGDGLGVMVELLPELALVTGPVAAPAPLAPEQAQARLARVLPRFIDVFTAPGRPLVLFLDDLQWADAPTLRMLDVLVRRPAGAGGHLLLLGAYRDNETPATHPLTAMRVQLARDGQRVSGIVLAPLTLEQVSALLADALRADGDSCAALAAVCYARTGGNPFFLNQFLQAMAEAGHLRYDADSDGWRWDLHAIAGALTTDNVGDLLAQQIGRLPAPARSLLQLGASIGSRFDLATLAVVAELAPAQAQAALWPALQAGLVQPLDGRYKYVSDGDAGDPRQHGDIAYRFLHDRVQQAAYLQAEPGARAARHLCIGRLLLAHASPAEREARLFAIVEQMNAGRMLIADGAERLELARLNHLAAVKARRSAAFNAALAHYDTALALLPQSDRWQPLAEHHGLWFELALGAAEAAYLCGDAAQAEAIYPRVRARCQDRLEHVRCIAIQAHQYQLQGRLLDAIALQREGLALLGYAIPLDAAQLQTSAEQQYADLIALPCTSSASAVDALLAAPEVRDPAAVAAMQLMQGLWMAGYYAGQQSLCMMMIMTMTRLSIEQGNSDFTPVGYVGFAMMQVVQGADPARAWRFGAMADRLARSRPNLQTRSLTALMFGAACSHWTRPLRDACALYDEALGWALEIGDFVQVGVVAAVRATDRVALGSYLPELLETTERDIALMRANGQHAMADCCVAAAVHPVRQLLGQAGEGEAFSEAAFMAQYGGSALYRAYYLQGQIRTACLLERDDATALAQQLELVTRLMRGQAKVHEASFHAALIWLRAWRGETDPERRSAIEASIAQLVAQLAQWAAHGPANLACRLALVRAEQARNGGDVAAAMRLYQTAADQAGTDGYLNVQALALELAARFWEEQGQPKVAAVFLRDAIARYRQWGAHAKVAALQQLPLLRVGRMGRDLASVDTTMPLASTLARAAGNEALDLASLLKAAQALGNEVGLGAVLGRLIAIVRENSGAQLARLLLREGECWQLEADLDEGDSEAQVLMGQAVNLDAERHPCLPLSVLRYALRSGEAVIEERILDAPLFGADPYVRASGATSVMCLPIRQGGRIDGLLYLENRLVAGCFSQERVEFLRMLAAQAMISIAHARLHDSLEARVAERTAQLEDANRKLATLSVTDGLTGLANRRHFDEVLRREWARCQRAGQSIAVIMLDIDHFKKFNDHHGHQAGDVCLAQVAASLQATLRRPGDVVARYGGEEFCVVLPEADGPHALEVAEHLRAAIFSLALPHAAVADGQVTISVGAAAIAPTPLGAADALLRAADNALYAAKGAGRNTVRLAAA